MQLCFYFLPKLPNLTVENVDTHTQALLIMKKIAFFVLFLSSLSLLAPAQGFELYEPISSYQADLRTLERKYSMHESQEYYDRINQHYNDWLATIEKIDFDQLSYDGKMDYILFRNHILKSQFLQQLEEEAFQKVEFVTDFASDLYQFVSNRRRGGLVNGKDEASLFHQSTLAFREANEDLEVVMPFSSWMEADKAGDVIKSLRENVGEAWQFYYGYHPAFSWWTETAYRDLEQTLIAYEKSIREHYVTDAVKGDGSGIVGRPIGREALLQRLQFEFIPYTPEELITIGEQQLEWCRNEMIAASRELGFGEDWHAALEHVKDKFVAPGEQPQMINGLAEEAIAFLEDNDLLTIPELAKETWRMEMMSAQAQMMNPFFLGGESIIISYPTHIMSHEAKLMSLRGNNPHFCKATVHHELIAGHHLQGFMNQRHKPYRRLLGTPFWLEGWPLYWEFQLYEMGLPEGPEDRMGFLFWRKHRAARILFSLRYHLGQMSPQECIDFLVEEVGHERANAEAEVRRSFMGRYDPLYQLAYMIGGIQFQVLSREMRGHGRTFREFHDEVMRQNNIPIELLRMYLLQAPLTKDFSTSWRFAEGYRP
jgi:uncharacterized protein (DUF885 family)